LPPGSIQAVIALSLIVLFAILSIFIFTSLGEPGLRKLGGLSAADRDKQVTQLGQQFAGWQPDGTATYTVFVASPVTAVRDDVGKQLIVLIGTLMTSAVSFYFGTRATAAGVAAATGDGGDAAAKPQALALAAKITKVEPAAGIPRGTTTKVVISGDGLSSADNVEVRQGAVIIKAATFKVGQGGLDCDFTPAAAEPAGPYDVVVSAAGKELATLPGGLKIT
jgi:hypothetical protein